MTSLGSNRAPIMPPPVRAKRPGKRRAPKGGPPRGRPPKRRSWLLSFIGFCFAGFVLCFLAAIGVGGYLLFEYSKDLPSYESLAEYEPPVMTRIHAHDGSLIAEYARERRIFVPINAIPQRVVQAFLSAEDKRFYDHGGIDLQGIARAVFKFVEGKIRGSNRRPEGASTITQQVAKNFLLTSERSIDRKIKEAILAVRIERAYPKAKILELYLNEIYLGAGAYGVAAASLNYFNKELQDLTIEQAAYLAALPKAPNNYHPFRHTKRATIRRDWIIGEMAENGFITTEEAETAKAKPLEVNFRVSGAHVFSAEFFAEEVRRSILAEYGEEKLYSGGLSVRTTLDPKLQLLAREALVEGLVAYDRRKGWRGPVKTIDVEGNWGQALGKIKMPPDMAPWRIGVVISTEKSKALVGLKPERKQDGKLAESREAVEIHLKEMEWAKVKGKKPKKVSDVLNPGDVIYVAPKDKEKLDGVWTLMQVPEVSGGLVAMDPHTGRVLAISGGFSFGISQFDRAVQAKRQPGSSFKPIVYAAALDNGYKPTSIVLDEPIEVNQGPGQDIWRPENYNKSKSLGPATLRTGIEKSRNQMTVRLARDMGMPIITEYAKRFGIYDDLLPVLSMSLGAGETTLLRMATGYCMLANGGKKVRPTLIDRIQDRWGRSVWKHDARECPNCDAEQWNGQAEPVIADDRQQIVDPYTAYQMTSIMEGVVQRGTAKRLKKLERPIAGKTGTTNEEKDAWFVGYSPDLVVGVYVGYDTPKPMGKGQTGGAVAAPIFGSFMTQALKDKPPTPFRIPEGTQLVRVNSKSGLRAAPDDPEAIMEAFKPDQGPDDAYSLIGFEQATDDAYEGDDPAASGSGTRWSAENRRGPGDSWQPPAGPSPRYRSRDVW